MWRFTVLLICAVQFVTAAPEAAEAAASNEQPEPMSYKLEIVPSPLSQIGKGAQWDAATQSVYYCDVYGNNSSLLRYDYTENKTYSAIIDNEPVVSFIIPVEGTTDKFAVGIGRRIGIISWDGKSPKATMERIALEVETDRTTNRFNEGRSDPTGRFYGGTMRLEEYGDVFNSSDGSLYKYAKDEELVKLSTNIGISNGMAWNMVANKFYYIDTSALDVKEYVYDPKTGDISNVRVLIDFKGKGGGFPDGMNIDADGFLYVTFWEGSKVLRIDPSTGEVVLDIKFPAEQITSVTFGGPNLDILYVTSAATDRARPQSAEAGSLFKVTGLGVKGVPMGKVRL